MNALKKTAIVSLVITALLSQTAPAEARHRGHHRRFPHYGSIERVLPYALATLIIGGMIYYYNEGIYYRKHEDHYIVVEPPIGTVVMSLPSGYQPVVIDGVAYYVVNNVTYMQTARGYQVVPQPSSIIISNNIPQPAPTTATTITETPATAPAPSAPIVVEKPYPDPAPITNSNGVKMPDKYQPEIFTVNIPNARGTYTAIPLKRTGNGYIGPQGEYYSEFPTVEQLKTMYAK